MWRNQDVCRINRLCFQSKNFVSFIILEITFFTILLFLTNNYIHNLINMWFSLTRIRNKSFIILCKDEGKKSSDYTRSLILHRQLIHNNFCSSIFISKHSFDFTCVEASYRCCVIACYAPSTALASHNPGVPYDPPVAWMRGPDLIVL